MQLGDEAQSDDVLTVRRRFSEISIIKLIFLLIVAIIAVATVFALAGAVLGIVGVETGFLWGEFFDVAMALGMIGVLMLLFRNHRLSFFPIFHRRTANTSDAVIVLPLIGFSLSSMGVIVIGLNVISADLAQAYLDFVSRMVPSISTDADSPIYSYLVLLVTLAILPSLLEELVFRAGMIERLGRKFGFKLGVIISALLFGLMHPFDLIGATVFGVVMGLLYLKNLSLFLPVLVHLLNNSTVVLIIYLDDQFLQLEAWDSVEQYTRHTGLTMAVFLLSGWWIFHFIRQNWYFVSIRKPIQTDITHAFSR